MKTSDMFWMPPPDHDDSPAAVAARIAAGEESDRRYEIRRNELEELEDDEYGFTDEDPRDKNHEGAQT